ncbi:MULTISPECIES: hypothetical protein [Myxococcus]|uniref:hypothetical protein n=1 Tax=Myxococcus TaxID=32 RepID=UPI0013D008DE|nr:MULTISPECIES: hypothetical protein [Myxococcus]NVJ25625.1 hypothetical protein [Myxococcus sp. AM011]
MDELNPAPMDASVRETFNGPDRIVLGENGNIAVELPEMNLDGEALDLGATLAIAPTGC